MLVHSRTPLAPLDTVRALSPGRGRQSSAQGFSFSTAGGDTSPGNLPHLNRSHSLVGSPPAGRVRSEEKAPVPPDHHFSQSRHFNTPPRPPPIFILPRVSGGVRTGEDSSRRSPFA